MITNVLCYLLIHYNTDLCGKAKSSESNIFCSFSFWCTVQSRYFKSDVDQRLEVFCKDVLGTHKVSFPQLFTMNTAQKPPQAIWKCIRVTVFYHTFIYVVLLQKYCSSFEFSIFQSVKHFYLRIYKLDLAQRSRTLT